MITFATEKQRARNADATATALRRLATQLTTKDQDAVITLWCHDEDSKEREETVEATDEAMDEVCAALARYVAEGLDPVATLRDVDEDNEKAVGDGYAFKTVCGRLSDRLEALLKTPAPSVAWAPTLAQTERLLRGLEAIDFEEFAGVLHDHGRNARDYAKQVWPTFQRHPIGFCASRTPPDAGEALYALAVSKTREPAPTE
jgi:hypothetical protein